MPNMPRSSNTALRSSQGFLYSQLENYACVFVSLSRFGPPSKTGCFRWFIRCGPFCPLAWLVVGTFACRQNPVFPRQIPVFPHHEGVFPRQIPVFRSSRISWLFFRLLRTIVFVRKHVRTKNTTFVWQNAWGCRNLWAPVSKQRVPPATTLHRARK